jgi:hypothetical protein
MHAVRLWLILPLAAIVGCAPKTLLNDPTGWPKEWGGRNLFTTPNAFIYAGSPAVAGEIDRAVTHARNDFVAETGGRAGRPLIIAHDHRESPPAQDDGALLSSALRAMIARELEAPASEEDIDGRLAEELISLKVAAAATGTSLATVYSCIPLECGSTCLRETVKAPAQLLADVDSALIMSTRARLKETAHRATREACEHFGIGPVARVALAPIIALMEAKCVNNAASARGVALNTYWAFRSQHLTAEERREIARTGRERVLSALSMDVDEVSRRSASAAAEGGFGAQ